jgi:hypothetical protein
MRNLLSRRAGLLALVALGAIGFGAALTGTAGAVVTPPSRCKDIIRKFHYGSPFRLFLPGHRVLAPP